MPWPFAIIDGLLLRALPRNPKSAADGLGDGGAGPDPRRASEALELPDQSAVDEGPISLLPGAPEQRLPLLLDQDRVPLPFAHREPVPHHQVRRAHAEVAHDGLAVDADPQIAPELVEG